MKIEEFQVNSKSILATINGIHLESLVSSCDHSRLPALRSVFPPAFFAESDNCS